MSDFDKVANSYVENMYLRGKSVDITALVKTLENLNETGEYGENLLHVAARYADKETLKLLSDKGVKPIPDQQNNTPLHSLAQCYEAKLFDLKYEDIYDSAKLLLKMRIDPCQKNENGYTAAMLAAEHVNYPFLAAMADAHVKMDETDTLGANLLHLIGKSLKQKKQTQSFPDAAFKSTQILIEKKIIDPDDTDSFGKTPLYYAESADDEALIILLSDNDDKIRLNFRLHKAVIDKDITSVELYLNQGADVNEVSEFYGKTPLMLACEKPVPEIIDILIKNGADINFREDNDFRSAIYYLLRIGAHNLDKNNKNQYLAILKKTLKLLIDNGLEINAPVDSDSDTPLILLCEADYPVGVQQQLAKELINAGCNVDLANINGITPLMAFAYSGSEQEEGIASLLIENNADCAATDKHNNTALMCAARNKNMLSGKKIVEHILYADKYTINNKNDQGETAMDIARRSGNEAIIKVIKENLGEW